MQIQISIDAICLEVLPQHFQTACLPLSNKYWQSSTRTINGINRPLPQTTSLLSINYNPKYQGTAILALHKTFQGREPADRDRVNWMFCFNISRGRQHFTELRTGDMINILTIHDQGNYHREDDREKPLSPQKSVSREITT